MVRMSGDGVVEGPGRKGRSPGRAGCITGVQQRWRKTVYKKAASGRWALLSLVH